MRFTKEAQIAMLEARVAKLEQNPDNLIKTTGVLRRLRANLEKLKNS